MCGRRNEEKMEGDEPEMSSTQHCLKKGEKKEERQEIGSNAISYVHDLEHFGNKLIDLLGPIDKLLFFHISPRRTCRKTGFQQR